MSPKQKYVAGGHDVRRHVVAAPCRLVDERLVDEDALVLVQGVQRVVDRLAVDEELLATHLDAVAGDGDAALDEVTFGGFSGERKMTMSPRWMSRSGSRPGSASATGPRGP